MAPRKAPSSRHRWPAPAGSHQDVDGGRFLGDRGESGAGAVRIRGYHIRIHRFPPDSRTATARASLCASSATRLSTRESVRESTPVDSGGPLNAPSETSLVSQGTQTLLKARIATKASATWTSFKSNLQVVRSTYLRFDSSTHSRLSSSSSSSVPMVLLICMGWIYHRITDTVFFFYCAWIFSTVGSGNVLNPYEKIKLFYN